MTPEIEVWADVGNAKLFSDAVANPQPWTLEEASALIRAAYWNGYEAALSEASPLTILEAGRRAAALRVALPIE